MTYSGASADANPIYGPFAVADDLRAKINADSTAGIDPTPEGGGGAPSGAARWVGPFRLASAKWQAIAMDSGQTSGTVTFAHDAVSATAVNWNASASDLQTALATIPALTGKVTCTGGPFATNPIWIVLTISDPQPFTVAASTLDPAFDPTIGVGVDPGDPSPRFGIPTVTLAAGDMFEDMFVNRIVGFPAGTKIEVRQTLDNLSTWDAPNDGQWKLDDAVNNWPDTALSGWDGSDPQYANLLSDAEREIWTLDGFYREVPSIASEPVTLYVTCAPLPSPGPDPVFGVADFYVKVCTPAAP